MAGHECVGYVEIDEFARKSYQAIYDTKGEYTEHDIRKIDTTNLPKADIWTFGFPCQDISVAGKQKGFAGERSSLFFAVTGKLRQLKDEQKPSYLLIENVKNLLSINGGRDFGKLQIELDEIGYDVEWDVLDTADVLPQHRERVYIVGHFRGRRTRNVFPITGKSGSIDSPKQKIIRVFDGRNTGTYGSQDVVSPDGIAGTLNTMGGGNREPKIMLGNKGGFIKHGTKILSQLWERAKTENYAEWSERVSKLVSTTEILRQIMYEQLLSQDSSEIRKCELVCSPQESQRNRYGYSLQDLWSNQEYRHPSYRRKYSEQFTREFNCFVQKLPHEAAQKKEYMQNLWKTCERTPSLQQALHQMEKIRESFVSQNQSKWRIRKLTPLETWRLQGFTDEQFYKAQAVNSNSQLYKQAGNSVSVPVVYAVAKHLKINA